MENPAPAGAHNENDMNILIRRDVPARTQDRIDYLKLLRGSSGSSSHDGILHAAMMLSGMMLVLKLTPQRRILRKDSKSSPENSLFGHFLLVQFD